MKQSPNQRVELSIKKEPNKEPPVQPSDKSQHQPYATSLVNSGFGFGFDLQGGDQDNQLTFIVNVQANGDAARKGLQDGNKQKNKKLIN